MKEILEVFSYLFLKVDFSTFFSYTLVVVILIENIIKYYYNLDIISLKNFENYYILNDKNDTYYLYHFHYVYPIYLSYSFSSYYNETYQFIYNSFNHYISKYDDEYYVLLKKNNQSLTDYIIPNRNISYHYQLKWRSEWIEIHNYFESQYEKIRGKYYCVDESILYFLGMLDQAIFYLKDYSNTFFISSVQRKIYGEENYNPFNYIEDVRERDFSEYLKYMFFNNIYDFNIISNLLHNGYNYYNYDLVIARLLYPNYYFRELQYIIDNGNDTNCLKKIISRYQEYEKYILKIIDEISKFYSIKKHPFI